MSQDQMQVAVKRVHRFSDDRNLKAFVDIVVGDVLLIKGISVMQGKGGLFVSMPKEQSSKDKKWYEKVSCLSQSLEEAISREVLAAYKDN